MHSESSLHCLCLSWPRLELCLTDRRYNNKVLSIEYIEVFKFADNLADSRLEITYPLALTSTANWRAQQQRAKIRDMIALCFSLIQETRDIYICYIQLRAPGWFTLFCLFNSIFFAFCFMFFTICTLNEYTQHNERSSASVSGSLWAITRDVSNRIDRRSDPQWAGCAVQHV